MRPAFLLTALVLALMFAAPYLHPSPCVTDWECFKQCVSQGGTDCE